jgi:hypothetical protein
VIGAGDLVRWTDGGIPHVARVVEVDGDEATVRYGPITATYPVEQLHPVADKDGRGNTRAAA